MLSIGNAFSNNEIVQNAYRNVKVDISTHELRICTSKVLNAEYAFYISHKNGIEKLMYSPSNEGVVKMDIDHLNGDYTARFFYKINKDVISIRTFFTVDKEGTVYFREIETIIDEEGYLVEFYNNNSPITFVVFNGDGSSKTTAAFGLGFLVKQGYNIIAVKQNNDRYQSLSFQDFKGIIAPLVVEKRVFLYGSSLGGYCALYYAGAINGIVIAAAPRNPVHPAIKELVRAKGIYIHDNILKNPITKNFVFIIMDKMNIIDNKFFNDAISIAYNESNALILDVPYGGHEVLLHLNYTGELKNILTNIVDGNYGDINIDNSLNSPYKDRTLALEHFKNKDYYKSIYYASKGLIGSKRQKLTNELESLIEVAIKNVKKTSK